MRVLVTGADGFIGSPLCRSLAEDGHDVIAVTREPRQFGSGIRPVAVGDLRKVTSWNMLDRCDAVVHLAAHLHRIRFATEDLRLFREVNVETTSRLAIAARQHGVNRFIFLSTVKVHGESSGRTPFVESSPIAPRDPYGRSKAEAEVAVRCSGVSHVILRPPLVYGPGVGANFHHLMRVIYARRPLPLAGIENRRSLLYVGNLVDAITRCLTSKVESGSTFLVRDGVDVSSPDLVRKIAAALDVEERLFPLPVSLLGFAATLLGRRAQLERLAGSLSVDDTAFREKLGWTPPFSLDEGLARTAEWFCQGRDG